MRVRIQMLVLVSFVSCATVLWVELAGAQPPARPVATAAPYRANVQQVMRGILFPNSNVVFAAQGDDPDTAKKDPRPSEATNPLASTYGGWEAVSNSALALNEAARLLEVARSCSNGKPAPIQAATWKKGLSELRAAGLTAYKAAQAKSQDQILEATDQVSAACSTCHDKYREKTPRCVE